MLGKAFNQTDPLFLQIKERIEDQIISAALKDDDQIPSTTQIVQFYKINHLTVSKGVNLLVDEGILYKKRGMGVFVKEGAKARLVKKRKKDFMDHYIRPMLEEATNLNINIEEVIDIIKKEGDWI